jgi:hypothetical protein
MSLIKILKEAKIGFMLLIIFFSLSVIGISGLLTTSISLPSHGNIKTINVQVFWDQACTQPVNNIDWGNPGPGDTVSKTVYLKNSGNSPLSLSLIIDNWTPSNSETYLTLSWDQEGNIINPSDIIKSNFSLEVSSNISGITDFTISLIIEGVG